MRASDRDRDRSAARLRGAYLSGEISTQTFDWRLEMALAARTREQLDRLTRDVALPAWRRLQRWVRGPAPVMLGLAEADAAEIVLGRSSSADVRVTDHSVSRRHAVLKLCDGVWMLEDLGSTNGTWLNGSRVTRAPVLPGDVIQLGEAYLRL
jgi:hypothetical protein